MMQDELTQKRERVIKGLEYCTTHDNCREDNGKKCPYFKYCEVVEGATGNSLEVEALEVIKGLMMGKTAKRKTMFVCGSCGTGSFYAENADYCQWCGARFIKE